MPRFAPILLCLTLLQPLNAGAQATGTGTQPADYAARVQQGIELAGQHRLDEAVDALRSAIFSHPELAGAHEQLAVVLAEQGDMAAAVRELEYALRLGPEHLRIEPMPAGTANAGTLKARYESLLRMRDATGPESTTAAASVTGTATTPSARAEPAAAQQDAIRAAVEAWRSAWSGRHLDAYFAAYADDFDPGSRFTSPSAWQAYKRRVIGRQSSIEVGVEHLQVVPLDDGTAEARFEQHFRSPAYSSDDRKTLRFARRDGEWKILSEQSR